MKNKADSATACYHGEILLHTQEKEFVVLHSFWNGEQVLPSLYTELNKKKMQVKQCQVLKISLKDAHILLEIYME